MKYSFMTLFAAIAATSAFAGDLRAPLDFESAGVLPAGIRNPRFKNLFLSMDSKFSGSGSTEPLGLKLNKTVSWNDVIEGQKSQSEKDKVQLIMNDAHLNANGSAGTTTGVVNAYSSVMVPVFAVGVTDALTLALAVPIMHIDISADTGFIKSGDGQAFANAAYDRSEWSGNDVQDKFNDGVNHKLTDDGYEPIQSHSETHIGDMQLLGKYRVYVNDVEAWSLKNTLTIPTGRPASVDRVVDTASGDGQWDVGVTGIYERIPMPEALPELRLINSVGYTAQLPDSVNKRIPEKSDSTVTPDKEFVDRDLGDQINAASSVQYDFRKVGVTVGTGYSFQYALATRYHGTKYDPKRYQWLEEQTPDQLLHSWTVGAGFSTIEFYKKKQFVYPFEAKLVYSHPLAGRNTGTNDIYSAELVMFF